MKNCGITRNVDELGRIVLPKELRNNLVIDSGTPLEIYTEGDCIILKKYCSTSECIICGSNDHTFEFKGKYICVDCKNEIIK